MEILLEAPVFIGFKASKALRHLLEGLTGVQRSYVASDDSAFLQSCEIGEDLYIGKFLHEAVSTDRVEDIRRNILSILRKLGPVVPLPTSMRIFSCRGAGASAAADTATELVSLPDVPETDLTATIG